MLLLFKATETEQSLSIEAANTAGNFSSFSRNWKDGDTWNRRWKVFSDSSGCILLEQSLWCTVTVMRSRSAFWKRLLRNGLLHLKPSGFFKESVWRLNLWDSLWSDKTKSDLLASFLLVRKQVGNAQFDFTLLLVWQQQRRRRLVLWLII